MQMLKGILDFSHHLLEESVIKGEIVVDATCGNGNDTLFLSRLAGNEGSVLALDIQEQAIRNTAQLLEENDATNVSLFQDSHAKLAHYLPSEEIGGAIFNLGYLPKSDKSIVTQGDTTIAALSTILDNLRKGGLVVLVVYHGHQGGKQEKETLLHYVSALSQQKYNVLHYGFMNQKNNPPFIIAIERRG